MLADILDRAHRDETPTIITRRGKQEAVVIDIEEYRRLTRLAEAAEDAWDTSGFGIKAPQGHSERRRLRVGDYRVVCTLEDGVLVIWVLAVEHRREVYRDL
ncbi:type II toxin-antitoxin system prevent-host-death family antitoxin [Streptomyces sp. NPDC004788]